jgi:RHS repeat-associated protein
VYASYIDEPVVRKTAGTGGTLVYFHRNQQYSITAVTTSTGSIAERYAYAAYGQPTVLDASASVLSSSAINNRYTYTGREWDATLGLHHFRARWMSPSSGRFLGRDPIEILFVVINLYEFLQKHLFSSTDPSGNISVDFPDGKIIEGKCGEELTGHLDFKLSNSPSEKGYIVQRVSVSCSGQDCPCKGKNVKVGNSGYMFLEAIPVEKDQEPGKPIRFMDFPHSDQVWANSVDGRCGEISQRTTIKFVPASKAANLKNWKNGITPYGPERGDCGQTHGGPLSTDDKEEMKWFLDLPIIGDENSAFTQRNFSFCCCGGEKDFFKAVFSGGTYEPGKAKNNFSQ